MIKKLIYASLLCIFLVYGYFVGALKIFPFPQLLAAKHYIEFSTGHFETPEKVSVPESVKIQNTFLERILLKKVKIPGYAGFGGGLSTSGQILYIVSNKGAVQTFDLNNYTILNNDISNIPMNFKELILSGHPYKNDFRINWFRVNGVYSENVNSKTQLLFVSHNSYNSNKDCITQNVSRTELEVNNKSIKQTKEWQTIFTASPCIDPAPDSISAAALYPGHISGGIITSFDRDNLLITVGDYNRNGLAGTDMYSMDPSNPYGKFILVNKKTGKWSIYADGSRNATGLYIDKNSNIWSVENGPQGGDELNLVVKGQNYGWPKVSYGLWYDLKLNLPGGFMRGTYPEYKKPVFSWVPSVAPRGVIKIEGSRFKYWHGDLLMGTMRDESLHRLRLDQNNHVVYDERIHLGHRIRDMKTLPDEKIALLTDDGYLIIIDDGGPIFQEMDSTAKQRIALLDNFDRFINPKYKNQTVSIVTNTSNTVFQQNCSSCHNLNGTNQIGPNLHDLFNRKVGTADNFNYSTALKSDKRNWNAPLLRNFLKNPESEFPGTLMQKVNLTSSEIDSLVDLFKSQNQISQSH